MPLLQLQDVTKTYRMGDLDVRALRGVTLDIEAGEFVAVMGPSGSGKSTIMNLVGCLDRPTTGRCLLDGADVGMLGRDALAKLRNRSIGFVFQSFNLLARTSALENVELPLVYAGLGSAERKARAKAALERVGLGDRLGHHPNQLSGGQQQRVAIARALVGNPRLIVADEPTGNLDSRASLGIMALFQELHDAGITLLLVTHEPEVSRYATRILVMRDGLVRSDTQQEPVSARDDLAALPPAEVAA